MAVATHCVGCGTELPIPNAATYNLKWCSERCRKASYGQPCVDCGARTAHGAESALVDEPRCPACDQTRRKKIYEEHRQLVVRLWAEGKKRAEIAAELGLTVRSVSVYIAKLRALGYDLPYRRPDCVENGRKLAEHRRDRVAA